MTKYKEGDIVIVVSCCDWEYFRKSLMVSKVFEKEGETGYKVLLNGQESEETFIDDDFCTPDEWKTRLMGWENCG